ncbi:MAG: hypothetical protein H6625_01400 [Bdellovibrionaceae bacterium]|nr:hypothetical protein [Pseudobdellovibrionaceae bacterium]
MITAVYKIRVLKQDKSQSAIITINTQTLGHIYSDDCVFNGSGAFVFVENELQVII